MRRRYANHFGVPLSEVDLVEIEDDGEHGERCIVHADGFPPWVTGGPLPKWAKGLLRGGL